MKTKQTKKEFMITGTDGGNGNGVVGKATESFMKKCYERTQDKANISYSLSIRTADNKFRFAMAKCKALEGYDFVFVGEKDNEPTFRIFGYIESYEFLNSTLELLHDISEELDLKYGLSQSGQLEPESIEIFKLICDKYVPPENKKRADDLAKQVKVKN